MAQPKKSAKAPAKKPATKAAAGDPFKVKRSKTQPAKETDTVTPPPDVAEAIDKFRECQDQARHFEGEATVYKDKVATYCAAMFTQRLLNGLPGTFKVLGDETMVSYVISDSSAGLSEEDVEAFTEKWGEDAADELITRDLHTIRFDPEVLAANYDEVVAALQTLRPEVLEKLFKPMLMKAKPGAVQAARQFAKTPEEMQEIVKDLKMKNYLK